VGVSAGGFYRGRNPSPTI